MVESTNNLDIQNFLQASDFLAHEVLRPLSHIRDSWDLFIDPSANRYENEDGTFAWLFNHLIDQLSRSAPPANYHDFEDRLAEHVQSSLNWKIKKQGNTWINESGKRLDPSDYLFTLEQGGFHPEGLKDLLDAAAGRILAAIKCGQLHFDDMERGHQVILSGVLTAILYHWEPYEELMKQRAGE